MGGNQVEIDGKFSSFLLFFFKCTYFFFVTKWHFLVLNDYLVSKNLTPTDCFKACVDKLDAGEFKYSEFFRFLF